MEVKVSINCEVKYHLIGFGGISGHYTSKDFEIVYDYLKEYNTDISHETGTLVPEEPSLKYHPGVVEVLT